MGAYLNSREKHGVSHYTFEFSKAEAMLIMSVVGNIIGSPKDTNREFSHSVREALILAEIPWVENHAAGSTGSISFASSGKKFDQQFDKDELHDGY